MRYLARVLSGVPWALLLLVGITGADVAQACPIATDKNGNFSPSEHIRCLREEAEQGDMLSQHSLGLAYAVGDAIPQDYEEAAKWFRRAANQGHSTSQFNLAGMYKSGRGGVPKDIVLSLMWLTLSAAQGNKYAMLARDREERKMTPAQIAEAQKLAREWKPKRER
jgi:uncharacterized protein